MEGRWHEGIEGSRMVKQGQRGETLFGAQLRSWRGKREIDLATDAMSIRGVHFGGKLAFDPAGPELTLIHLYS